MATYDLTVMGAGVFGLSVAQACAARGAKVQVIDPAGVGTGASGGLVGALAPHVPENWNAKKAFQLRALLMAPDYWANIAALSGQNPGYARSGRLQPLADEKAISMAQARAAQSLTLWQGQALWQVVANTDHPDWAPHSPTGLLIHDTLSARIHPRQATLALAAALTASGGVIGTEGSAQGAVLWATGHMGLTAQGMGNGVKGQAALLGFSAPEQPQLFADGLHIVPHADGTTAIGSTSERLWDDASSTDAQLDAVITRARAAFPALAGATVLERWAGIRPRAHSRSPLLGAWPGRPGHYIANGGFKIGFGIAPLVGQVMADLILDGADTIPADFLPPAH